MSLDFVAIDFETANSFRGSPCAVGMTRVIDGQVVEQHSRLMRPPKGHDHFDRWNIAIHRITPDMVRGEPRFAQVFPEILDFINGLPIVAHYAAFDIGVIRNACDVSDLDWPTLRYACTCVLARRTYRLLSYSLPFVAEVAGCNLENHHEAGADALASAEILLAIAKRNDAEDLESLLAGLNVAMGIVNAGDWRGCTHGGLRASRKRGSHDRPPPANENADPNHPMFGSVIVFTGKLQSMTRSLAWEMVAEVGGFAEENVTKDTDVLVIGDQDPRMLRPGMTVSNKMAKAARYLEKGLDIEVMGEQEFLAEVADSAVEGVRS